MISEGQDQQNRKYLKDRVKGITYTKGKMLGSGGFAKCYQAISEQDGKVYAAKVIPKKSINQKRQRYKLLVEIKIHRSLQHKYIVGFKDAFEDKENIYILLQYCRNYTLKELVKRRKRLTEHQARVYIGQIIKAIDFIHKNSIIHRDLKLGNILINDKMQTKICDFGLSTKVKKEGQIKRTICGTPNYIAPQILQQQGHSYQVDIWSIGVILYTLLFGKPPFQDNTVQQTYQNIKLNRFSYPPSIKCSQSAKDLISKILVMQPSKRLTLSQILSHQFMKIPFGLTNSLSCSTLAVPPINNELQIQKINLNDVNIQQNSQISLQKDNEGLDELDHLLKDKKKQKKSFKFTYIRQLFEYNGYYGFLLSNGLIGIFLKQSGINIILDFGSQVLTKYEIGKPMKREVIPQPDQYTKQIKTLMHFRSFYTKKYSIFKLDQMNKRHLTNIKNAKKKDQEQNVFIKKINDIVQGRQVLTRLSNSIIQLHFKDITSVMINYQQSEGIYYIDSKGQVMEIDYNSCKSIKIKAKVRKFSHVLQLISMKNQPSSQLKNSLLKQNQQ